MSLPFTKMQGVGNDFVVVDEGDWADGDWAARARALCDRRFGVGADGLIVIGPSSRADVRMRFFNPDGTPDMCGNGLRCVVRFAHGRGRIGERGHVETIAGVRAVTVGTDGIVTAEMGVPHFAPADLPMRVSVDRVVDFPLPLDGEALPISAVSTGSTHTVVFVDRLPDDDLFFRLSPRIENHPLFPERTSVMWTRVAAPDRIDLRIWERAAGETLGCGTGACAAAVVARAQGKVASPEVTVVSRGGTLRVGWPGGEGDTVLLSGPAEIVFTGLWPDDPA